MKTILYIFALYGFVLIGKSFKIQDVERICIHENSAFGSGEQLIYKVYYNLSFIWIPAGEVYFSISETDSTFHFEVFGRSYKTYDGIIKIRNKFSSIVSKRNLMPLEFNRSIQEGDQISFDRLHYDYIHGLIHVHTQNGTEKVKQYSVSLEDCTYDFVSMMYSLRNVEVQKYQPRDVISTLIFFGHQYIPIDILYVENEAKKIRNLGKVDAIKIEPTLIYGNVFTEKNKMNIWISNDENKIPLLIESSIRVGKIKAVLQSYKDLSYPLIID